MKVQVKKSEIDFKKQNKKPILSILKRHKANKKTFEDSTIVNGSWGQGDNDDLNLC